MFNRIKYLMGFEEVEEEIIETPRPVIRESKKMETFQPAYSSNKDNKVVSMQNVSKSGGNNMKLVLIEPKSFEECPRLVDNLKSKKPLIINLEKIDRDTARKIFDFLSGATYALDGNVQRVSNNIFVFAPENIDVAASQESKRNSDTLNPWG